MYVPILMLEMLMSKKNNCHYSNIIIITNLSYIKNETVVKRQKYKLVISTLRLNQSQV